MDEAQERMIRKINENSLRQRQFNEQMRVKQENYRLKKEKKDRFLKRINTLLLLAAIIAGLSFAIPKVVRQHNLDSANKYMKQQINFVCPELDRGVLSDGTVYLFDNSENDLHKLSEELINEFGFSRDCAIYCISKHYGDDAFDKVVRSYGYDGKDSFLYELYSRSTSISSSGETVYAKEGSYKNFEENVQVEFVNKVSEIKEFMDNKKINSKGLGL